jgi:hypothetical protein
MAEDIEIMQHILGKALKERFSQSQRDGDGRTPELTLPEDLVQIDLFNRIGRVEPEGDLATTSLLYELGRRGADAAPWAHVRPSDFDVQGFYIPGTGVVYTLKFPARVKVKEVEAEQEGDDPAEDDWVQIEREVRGTGTRIIWDTGAGETRKRYALDEDDLGATIHALLEAIGKYGARIEQLGGDEAVTLAARVTGRSVLSRIPPFVLVPDILPILEIDVAKRRVIIKVPAAAIRDFSSGKIDLKALEDRAEITRYQTQSTRTPASSLR